MSADTAASVRTGEGGKVRDIWAALGEVMDPEFPISLVDLGLIYDVRRAGSTVEIDLTFTATACPCMDFIHEDIRERLLKEEDIEEIKINQVWDPPWTVDRISEAGKQKLKECGVAT
jgi:metal-sulfur cluster biosynthetic enzyme